MMHDDTLQSPQRMLLTARVMWVALIGGQLMFLMFVALLLSRGLVHPIPDHAATLLNRAAWVMLLLALFAGYHLRNQAYKKHWRADVITPHGYLVGNLLLWALCEGVALIDIGFCLLEGSFWPGILPAVVAMAVHVYNFPDGRPMFSPGEHARLSDAMD